MAEEATGKSYHQPPDPSTATPQTTMADVKGGEEDEGQNGFCRCVKRRLFPWDKSYYTRTASTKSWLHSIKFTRNILAKHKKRFCKLQAAAYDLMRFPMCE